MNEEKDLLKEIELHERNIKTLLESLNRSVSGQTEETKVLQEKLDTLIDNGITFPDSIKTTVENQPTFEIPEKQKVEVENWPEQKETLKLDKPDWWQDPKDIEFPAEIKVSNFPKFPLPLKEVSVTKPKWYQPISPSEVEKAVSGPLSAFWKALKDSIQKVRITNKGGDQAVPVTLFSPEGQAYSASGSSGGVAIPLSASVSVFDSTVRKTAILNFSSSGDNEVVAAVTGKRIMVYAIIFNTAGTVSVKWKDGSTDLTGAMVFNAREGMVPAVEPPYTLLQTSAGNALNINLSASVAVNGWLCYWEG
jgi:hypothetical protein